MSDDSNDNKEETIVKDPDFYKDVYRESGDQVRNINALRNTYLGFFIVGVAALASFMARAGIPNKPDRSVWFILTVFSFIGILVIWLTWDYVRKALGRQRKITALVMPDVWLDELDLGKYKTGEPNQFSSIREWARDHRLELLSYGVYIFFFIISFVFGITGDPFGFTG